MSSAGSIKAGAAYVEIGAITGPLSKALKEAEAKLKAFSRSATAVGKAMFAGAAAVATPLVAAGKAYAEVGAALARASAKTGATVESLSTLGYAAQQSGVDMEGLEHGLTHMQKAIGEAAGGSKEAAAKLAELGLSITDLQGLSPDQQFKLIADKLSQIQDPANRAQEAMAIFGKAGADLLPLLDQGGAGIEQMQKRARALGLEMSGESAKGALQLAQAFDDLKDVTVAAAVAIGSAVGPVLKDFAQRATHVVMEVTEWAKAHKDLFATALKVSAGIAAVGAAMVAVGQAAGLLAPAVGAIGAAVAAVGAPVGVLAAAVIGIGGAFAYAVGSGDTFASRIMSGLGKVADFLDTMLGSWDGFTTSMAAVWQQLKPRLLNVWLDLKGALIGIWDELKGSFPGVVYGWGGALAEFAVKAYGVMKDLAMRIASLWRKAQGAVMDFAAEEMVRQKFKDDPKTAETAIAAVRKSRQWANDAEDAKLRKSLDASDAGTAGTVKDIQDWSAAGRSMTPGQHEAEAARHRKETQDAKDKNNADAAKDWADYLAQKAGLPKLSDAVHKVLDGAKDFFGKGPELPAVPDVQKKIHDGLDHTKKTASAAGTFNARAATMMGGTGGPAHDTAKHTLTLVGLTHKVLEAIKKLEKLGFS